MGIEKKIQQRTIESRKKLLDAAYRLFVNKGYYNTNTKEIAHHAGVSIGNFYNYYQDKGEIYCALLEEYSAFLSSSLCQLLDHSADRNRFFMDAVVIAKENMQVRSIIFQTEEKLIDILESFLRQRYPNRQMNYHSLARMIYILTDQIAKDILRVEIGPQREDYIQLFIDEIIHFSFDL